VPIYNQSALIRRIHATSTPTVLAVTGGGSGAISSLLQVPGASRTVLEAVVPYSADSLAAWLGSKPEHACSQRTARAMAMFAYERAVRFASGTSNCCGLGCTAGLVSDRPKHGPHRVHAALQSASITTCLSLELVKGERDRRREEAIASSLVLNLLAEACGLKQRLTLKLLAGEEVEAARIQAPQPWQDLLAGRTALVAGRAGCPSGGASGPRRVVLAGAFNPRHDGHNGMARLAGKRFGCNVEHEISILNVDKPPLDFIEMQHRAEQFAVDEPLWFTRAATFVEKSVIFPGATFVVGADTIARIAEAKYYGDDLLARDRAIEAIAAADCRFLVFGRLRRGGFQSLGDLGLPAALLRICDAVPDDEFRLDISSTELRQAAGE
jgi:nicotinamide mononucleotide (NMN) deamidase PncC